MDVNKINLFLAKHGGDFDTRRAPTITSRLEAADDAKYAHLCTAPFKNVHLMFIYSFFLGIWGVDRFMRGDLKNGFLKLSITTATLLFEVWQVLYTVNYFVNLSTSYYGNKPFSDALLIVLSVLIIIGSIVTLVLWAIDVATVVKKTREYNYECFAKALEV